MIANSKIQPETKWEFVRSEGRRKLDNFFMFLCVLSDPGAEHSSVSTFYERMNFNISDYVPHHHWLS